MIKEIWKCDGEENDEQGACLSPCIFEYDDDHPLPEYCTHGKVHAYPIAIIKE